MSISTTLSPEMTRYLFVRVISVEGEGFTMENSNVSFRKYKVYASMGVAYH